MQKILFIITKSEIGGAQKFVKEQIDISTKEFDVYLCCNQDGWLSQQSADKLKGHFFSSSIEKKTSLFFLFQLIKFIKQNKIALVITNSANAGFYGRLAAFFARTNACYFSHGWSSVYNGGKLSFLLNFIERILAYTSNKVICVSNNDYQIALNKIGIPKNKLVVIKNAILPAVSSPSTKGEGLGVRLKVIALARFANPKRIDLMIQTFEQIKDAELSIAGSGPDFEKWQQYIQEKKIANVKLLGEVPSFAAFNEYNALLLISNSEGLPISAIEAMSAGLPLILSNVGGCPELINDNGILVENNTESIKEAVAELAKNYKSYQKNAINFYNKEFNLFNVKDRYTNLYTSLINE
jgi:glycosyltransferase involved in cell wall biosynthesis